MDIISIDSVDNVQTALEFDFDTSEYGVAEEVERIVKRAEAGEREIYSEFLNAKIMIAD